MTPAVQAAVTEVEQSFPGHRLDVTPESQGGAYVIVHDLNLGGRYAPATSWIGFLIRFQYPYADVYPHFVQADLKRIDGANLPSGFSGPIAWNGRQALQISRRPNPWSAGVGTAPSERAKVVNLFRNGGKRNAPRSWKTDFAGQSG